LTLTSCGPRTGIDNNESEPKETQIVIENQRSEAEQNGLKLFKLHCIQCHEPINSPAKDGSRLENLFDRIPQSADYFNRFVQNSDSLKKSGDAYANYIDKENLVEYEHLFKGILSDKEINDLAEYIKHTNRPAE